MNREEAATEQFQKATELDPRGRLWTARSLSIARTSIADKELSSDRFRIKEGTGFHALYPCRLVRYRDRCVDARFHRAHPS